MAQDMQDIPAPAEAEVIRLARMAGRLTVDDAVARVRAAGGQVSPTYWRDIERGHGGRRGRRVPARASEGLLAQMAHAVSVTPGQLAGAGRGDAAQVLEEILRRDSGPDRPEPQGAPPAARPEVPTPPGFLTDAEKADALPWANRIFDRIGKVRAGRDPATLSGQELFAGDDDAEAAVLADGWDAVREGALRGAFGWDTAAWLAGLAFHRNARAEERRRPGRSGTRGALILV